MSNTDSTLREALDEIFQPLINNPSLTLTTTYWNEAKQQLYELITKEIIGEDEALYVASPPIMLPVTTNPLEVMEVEYQRDKIMREIEQYKIIMVESNLRQKQRQKALRLFNIKEIN